MPSCAPLLIYPSGRTHLHHSTHGLVLLSKTQHDNALSTLTGAKMIYSPTLIDRCSGGRKIMKGCAHKEFSAQGFGNGKIGATPTDSQGTNRYMLYTRTCKHLHEVRLCRQGLSEADAGYCNVADHILSSCTMTTILHLTMTATAHR